MMGRRENSYARGLRNAELDGRAAAERDLPRGSNPYRSPDFRMSWEAGWEDGARRKKNAEETE